MAAGDTQELVVANLAGLGADRLSSITVLRAADDKAQAAYNNLFKIPGPPPAPVVSVAALDGRIVLTWGDTTTINKTEGTVDQGFAFEGYNIYEYPPPTLGGSPILLGTYDLKDGVTIIADTVFDASTGLNLPTVLQKGSDNGIIRSITLTGSKVTGGPLVNGTTYHSASLRTATARIRLQQRERIALKIRPPEPRIAIVPAVARSWTRAMARRQVTHWLR